MIRTLLLFCLSAGIAAAQKPTFEVISIKPHRADDNHRAAPQFLPGGRFTSAGMPLRILIATAYKVGSQSPRLIGGPAWINSLDTAYDIEATAPKGMVDNIPGKDRDDKMRAMLQELLEDRFHLKVHRESKEMSVYAVVVGKGGPKLEKSKVEEKDCAALEGQAKSGAGCHSLIGGRGRGLHGEAVSLSDVVPFVENYADRPMIDRTGIQGLFNIQTRGWLPLQPGPPPPPGAKGEGGEDLADMPTLFQLFEQFGLKLEAQKAAVDIFVIDAIEKPTAN